MHAENQYERRRVVSPEIFVCITVAIVSVLVFWRVRSFDFVVYDDFAYVVDNPHVNTGLRWENVRGAFFNLYVSSWFPLAIVSHLLDVELYGLNAGGHHATSLLLHLANTALLFTLLVRMTGARWPSVFVAALFALHPLHVEPVAWISARKDVLSAFFLLLTLLAYASYGTYRTHGANGGRFPRGRYFLVAACFVLAMLAKSVVVTLPVLLLLLDYWPLRRGGRGVRALVLEKVPLLVLAAPVAVLSVLTQRAGGALRSLEHSPLHVRVENAAVVYLNYLEQTVWPVDLTVMYPNPGYLVPATRLIVALVVLAVVSLAAVRFRRRAPYLFTGWFWYLIALSPVIGIFQIGDHVQADRYTYVPLIGVFIAAAWGGAALIQRWSLMRWVIAPGALAVIALCAALSSKQAGHWRDSVTLFRRAVEIYPHNALAWNNLGVAYSRLGDFEEAARAYRRAVRYSPPMIEAFNNYGHALIQLGRYEPAVDVLAEAVYYDREYANAIFNRGVALAALGRHDEAAAHFERVTRLEPARAEAWNRLGIALAQSGEYEEAAEVFRKLIELAPGSPEGHANLGMVLLDLDRPEDARPAFERALAIDPSNAVALEGMRRLADAARE